MHGQCSNHALPDSRWRSCTLVPPIRGGGVAHQFRSSDGEEYPGAEIESDDELLDAARHWGSTTYHVMGTCGMGPDSDPMAVVDDNLRVKGIANLRVIDASIMPTMLSANLNAGAMMIGEKGADLVLGNPAPEPIITADDSKLQII